MNTTKLTNAARLIAGLALLAASAAALAGEFTQPRPGLHTGGQPSQEQIEQFAGQGVRTVIDLRPDSEARGYDEAALVKQQGLRYVQLPIAGPDDLTPENAAALKQALDESQGPVLLHCASGNRVGALLALMARQQEGTSREQALELGREAGLKSLAPVVEERLDP